MALRFVKTIGWFLVGLFVSTSLPLAYSAEDSSTSLLAGAHAQEITPPKFPVSVNGNMADQLATAAHDPLFARCIVLKESKSATQPDTAIAIVVCDSCMIPRNLLDRAKILAAKKTGIPASKILISATHAHSCPTLTGVFQSDPDADYIEFLIEQIAKGIERANSQLEPARIGWGSVDQPNLVFNRRWLLKDGETTEDPFGRKSDRVQTNPGFGNLKVTQSQNVIDPDLSVLSIQSRDGRPIALLANYSLHYVGGVAGNVVSADYFGEFSQRVARQLKATDVQPPFVGIMSNGTSGDINNVDFRQKSVPAKEPFEQIQLVAETLAADAASVCKRIEYRDNVPVRALEAEIAPVVIILRLTAHVDHRIDGRTATQHFSARIGDGAAAQTRFRHGFEQPVGPRIADGEQIADRNMEPDPVVIAAGFQQQHTVARIGRQAIGQDASGRARAHDDIVELVAVE